MTRIKRFLKKYRMRFGAKD
jgi:hypothetical protein